jgi:hypothetical protein
MRVRTLVFCVVVAMAFSACTGNGGGRARPTTTYRPSPPSTAPAEPPVGFLSVSAGHGPGSVTLWNWQGEPLRPVPSFLAACCVGAGLSPDAARVTRFRDGVIDVIDLQGGVIARSVRASLWADDSQHLCDVEPRDVSVAFSSPANLIYSDGSHVLRVIAGVGGYGPHANPVVMWCSATHQRAIVGERVMGDVVSARTVDLRTGRVSTPSWASSMVALTAISGDGTTALLRDNMPPYGAALVDVATGVVKAHLQASPIAISWRGSVVIASAANRIEAIDWPRNRVVWRSDPPDTVCPCTDTTAVVRARPGTDDLALTVAGQRQRPWNYAELWLLIRGEAARKLRYPVAPVV